MSFEAFNFPFVRSFLRECKCKFTSIHSARLNSSEISSTNIRKHDKVPRTIVFFSLIWAFDAWVGGERGMNYHFSDAQYIQIE